ncbi:AAA family ATPase [Corynebacterium variabile]|uniref:AAA family ATPase n=1 Tax=Corynebacterium variabile TaxID=1727 RepID=UPI003BB14C06
MLLSLTIENYRSFATEAVLDLQKRSFRTNLPKSGSWAGVTERIAGLYGPNASGKSTVLRALSVLQSAVYSSVQNHGTVRALRTPHALHPDDETFFEVEYVRGGIRYRWSVTLTDEGVTEETLEAVGGAGASAHWRRLFTRTGQEISFGQHFGVPKAARENIEQFLGPWVLALSAWRLVRDPGPYVGAAQWWFRQLRIAPTEGLHPDPGTLHTEMVQLMVNPRWSTAAKAVLGAADVGVTGVRIVEEELPADTLRILHAVRDALNDDGDDTEESEARKFRIDEVRKSLEFNHVAGQDAFPLREDDESRGTRFWLDLALMAVRSLVLGEVLVIDELDASLHPALVRFFIDLFLTEATNPSGAQLVFTSHDVTSLGNTLGEGRLPESTVWLVDKRNAESVLVCLDEYNLRLGGKSNMEKRYLEGAFGAMPIIGAEIENAIAALHDELESSKKVTD